MLLFIGKVVVFGIGSVIGRIDGALVTVTEQSHKLKRHCENKGRSSLFKVNGNIR